jgi:hypothetical protein
MYNGTVYSKPLDSWLISWESCEDYRFWCLQEHPSNYRIAAVVMLNPGSLSGTGENLNRDTTLRILRHCFEGTSYNPFVINLFNLATTDPDIMFKRWEQRDYPAFSYQDLPIARFSSVMYAYGDYENGNKYPEQIKERIATVRDALRGIPEIEVTKNPSGSPTHPRRAQLRGLRDVFRERIIKHATANTIS